MSKSYEHILNKALESGELLKIVEESKYLSDVVRRLNYTANGIRVAQTRKYLEENIPSYCDFFEENLSSHIIDKKCPVCNKIFRVSSTNKKEANQTTCGLGCSNTYFRSGVNNGNFKGGSYRNKAIKEYGEKCQLCGFDNPLAIVVHHIDGDRENNEIQNLIVLCANCHYIAHDGANFNKKNNAR